MNYRKMLEEIYFALDKYTKITVSKVQFVKRHDKYFQAKLRKIPVKERRNILLEGMAVALTTEDMTILNNVALKYGVTITLYSEPESKEVECLIWENPLGTELKDILDDKFVVYLKDFPKIYIAQHRKEEIIPRGEILVCDIFHVKHLP